MMDTNGLLPVPLHLFNRTVPDRCSELPGLFFPCTLSVSPKLAILAGSLIDVLRTQRCRSAGPQAVLVQEEPSQAVVTSALHGRADQARDTDIYIPLINK